ncbi:MAG: helix-turn-helix domain-containing protein [Nitrospirae bacterium]|nr:helix-turn-helix domain-containing protein [Nitrospirota bacterium]
MSPRDESRNENPVPGAGNGATDMDVPPRLLRLRDSAQVMGISYASMYRLVRSGEITPVMIGTRIYIEPAELDKFVDRHRRKSVG